MTEYHRDTGDNQKTPRNGNGDSEGSGTGGALTKGSPTDITKEAVKDMGGTIKIHVRLNLEVDIRVIAKVKGDIAIGLL